jgi:hypothetical protein
LVNQEKGYVNIVEELDPKLAKNVDKLPQTQKKDTVKGADAIKYEVE